MKFRQVIKPNGEIVQEITDDQPVLSCDSCVSHEDREWEREKDSFGYFLRNLALVATIGATLIMLFRS